MFCTICRVAQSADRQFAQPDCTIWRFLITLGSLAILLLCAQKLFDVGVPIDSFIYYGSSLTLVFHPSFTLLAGNFIGDAPAFSVSITQSVMLKEL